jgi:uncharacterized protein YccT (UPF0319 family)
MVRVQDAFDNPSWASISCQQDQVASTITADATNLQLNFGGYNLENAVASIGGQTTGMLPGGKGATDNMTELVVACGQNN